MTVIAVSTGICLDTSQCIEVGHQALNILAKG